MSGWGSPSTRTPFPSRRRSPFVTSGIRIGTPAVTTRGMKEPEMERIANMIADVLNAPEDLTVKQRVSREVRALCDAFPLYPERIAAYAAR